MKIKCKCECGRTLYVSNFGYGEAMIGSEKNARKSMKNFKGVVVNTKELISFLREK